jgi:hypothetical protein
VLVGLTKVKSLYSTFQVVKQANGSARTSYWFWCSVLSLLLDLHCGTSLPDYLQDSALTLQSFKRQLRPFSSLPTDLFTSTFQHIRDFLRFCAIQIYNYSVVHCASLHQKRHSPARHLCPCNHQTSPSTAALLKARCSMVVPQAVEAKRACQRPDRKWQSTK